MYWGVEIELHHSWPLHWISHKSDWLRLGHPSSIPGRGSDHSLRHHDQAVSGVHPATYQMDTRKQSGWSVKHRRATSAFTFFIYQMIFVAGIWIEPRTWWYPQLPPVFVNARVRQSIQQQKEQEWKVLGLLKDKYWPGWVPCGIRLWLWRLFAPDTNDLHCLTHLSVQINAKKSHHTAK
jgi:hypothetical protein